MSRSHPSSRRAARAARSGIPFALGPIPACIALACLPGLGHAADGAVRVLDSVRVSSASSYTAQTPVAARDGVVYVATMEPGPSGDDSRMAGNLRTVVRKGVETSPGQWSWTATSIEDRTVADAWHNAPAIGIDEAGYVHVAYNMHNLPWQYAVSTAPGSIDAFEFRGQPVTQAELDRYRLQNRTSFPSLGGGAIPGNQISYPAFQNDRAGRLYATYRFAARPARAWSQRNLSAGVARYDAGSRAWRPLGGVLDLAPGDHDGTVEPADAPRAVASSSGSTPYVPRLTFGPDDAPTVSLMWRGGGPGEKINRPCALEGDVAGLDFTGLDGAPVTSPAVPDDCPAVASADAGIEYYSIGDVAADSAGHHHMLLSPAGRGREIHSWTGDRWTSEPAPGEAVEIFFDPADNLWAVAMGPAVYVRRAGSTEWENVVGHGGRECLPHAALDTGGRTAYVFTLGCDSATASVTKLDLEALLGGPIEPVGGAAVQPVAAADADRAVADPATDPASAADASADASGSPADGSPADGSAADGAAADGAVQDGTAQEAAAQDPTAADGTDVAGADAGTDPVTADDDSASLAPPDAVIVLGPRAAADGPGPLVLPTLEWRKLSLPESSVGLTAGAVFAELPADAYGETWTLYGHDPAAGRYFVPTIDEPLAGGSRYWAIQVEADVVVVELARAVPVTGWE